MLAPLQETRPAANGWDSLYLLHSLGVADQDMEVVVIDGKGVSVG